MSQEKQPSRRIDPSFKPLMRNLALELAIYTPLVTIYFLLILHFAKEPLVHLYHETPTSYAIIATMAIVGQGVLLEALTSWLLHRIGLR